MKKYLWMFLFVLALLVPILFGCGTVSSPASSPAASPTATPAPVTPTNVTFSGAAAAGSSDLAQLGVSSLGIESKGEETARINKLKSMGFDEAGIKALNLKPLAGSDTTCTLYTANADGSYTEVADGIISDGNFLVTADAYDSSKTYIIKSSKTSSSAGKELNLDVIVDQKASTSDISGLVSNPQSTLLTKIIIDEVIKITGSASIDAEVIQLISSMVKDKITYLISAEGLQLSTVKGTSDAESLGLKNAAMTAFTDSVIQKAIQAVKFNAGLAKGAASLADAKKMMKEIFTLITGSPSGIPESILNSFAQSYYEGKTKTVAEIAAACDKAVFKNDGTPVTGLYTTSSVSVLIKEKLDLVYGALSASSIRAKSGPQFEVKNQSPVVQAVFPASVWAGKTIDGSTVMSVPQVVALIEALAQVGFASGNQFNHSAAAKELGFMSGVKDEFSIMHSELRIESWEDWQNFHPTQEADRPPISSILTSFMQVGNIINPMVNTTGITARLVYQNTSSGTTIKNYTKQQMFGKQSISGRGIVSAKQVKILEEGQGPPPGFVMFQISPWGGGPGVTPETVSNFLRGGLATIEVYNNGTLIVSSTITIPSVDLTSAAIEFKNPLPNMFQANSPLITQFQVGAKPVCSFSFGVGSPAIDFGSLSAGYAVEIREVDANTGMPKFETQALYSSWHKQDFLKAVQGDTLSWTVPATLSSTPGTVYSIMGAVIGINSDGWPVVSGPWRSTLFKVGSAGSVASTVITIEGTVTPPASPQNGKTIKVGLFKMEWNMNFMNSDITPKTVVSGSGAYSMTLDYSKFAAAGPGGYDTIAWEDDGDGIINGAAGERPIFPTKHLEYHGGTLNVRDQTFTPLGAVTATQNNTGYDIDMSKQFWGTP